MERYVRDKVMRGLDDEATAQKAKVETDRAEWMSLIKKASQHQRETSS